MNVSCALTRRILPSFVERPLPLPVRHHADHCLRCQAGAAAHRSLQRDLARLGDMTVEAPQSVARAVAAAVAAGVPVPAGHRRWPVAAAATSAAFAVGGAVTMLLRRRARPVA